MIRNFARKIFFHSPFISKNLLPHTIKTPYLKHPSPVGTIDGRTIYTKRFHVKQVSFTVNSPSNFPLTTAHL